MEPLGEMGGDRLKRLAEVGVPYQYRTMRILFREICMRDEHIAANGRKCIPGYVQAVRVAAERIANESMPRAADKVKEFYEPDEKRTYKKAVSGDGIWRGRGFSSSFGVVTVLPYS